MKCVRCGQEFGLIVTNVCGTCADDLRQEDAAAEEENANISRELDREAYEDALRTRAEVESDDIRFHP